MLAFRLVFLAVMLLDSDWNYHHSWKLDDCGSFRNSQLPSQEPIPYDFLHVHPIGLASLETNSGVKRDC